MIYIQRHCRPNHSGVSPPLFLFLKLLPSRPPWWVCGGGTDARHLPNSASSINRKQPKKSPASPPWAPPPAARTTYRHTTSDVAAFHLTRKPRQRATNFPERPMDRELKKRAPGHPEREFPALLVVWEYQQNQLIFGTGEFFLTRKREKNWCFFRLLGVFLRFFFGVFAFWGGVFVLLVFFCLSRHEI